MKTLDEVIKAYEICLNINETSCRGCPYTEFNAEGKWACSLCGDCTEDALYYLKTIETTENLYHDAVTELSKWKDEDWKDRQLPLTWDELKEMEGKPVWIELLNHGIWEDPSHGVDSEWWVIGEVRKDDIILATYLDEMELCEEDIGVLWKAYRKEEGTE